MTTIGFFMTLISFMCSQCMNFACPINRVDEKTRGHFFDKNPVVAAAWGKGRDRASTKSSIQKLSVTGWTPPKIKEA